MPDDRAPVDVLCSAGVLTIAEGCEVVGIEPATIVVLIATTGNDVGFGAMDTTHPGDKIAAGQETAMLLITAAQRLMQEAGGDVRVIPMTGAGEG